MSTDLIDRLRVRATIRRQISTRKSVQLGEPDRIADLLEEAADALELAGTISVYHPQWDACYNPHTGTWLEATCGDPTCEYCASRPPTAYERT